MKFIIIDWAGNHCFQGTSWQSFEDAEAYLCGFFDHHCMDYEVERGEYEIVEFREGIDALISSGVRHVFRPDYYKVQL